MTHLFRTGAAAAVCLLFLAACGSESKIETAQPKSLVLARSDLPSQFQVFSEGPTATLDVQGTPRSSLQRFGRKGGWVARFNRGGSADTKGPLVVVSTVDVFKDSGGAKDDLGAFQTIFGRTVAERDAHPVDVGDLGDDAAGVTIVQPGAKPVRSYIVAWRDRNATGSISANGFDGRIQLADVLRLARIQEKKMAGA